MALLVFSAVSAQPRAAAESSAGGSCVVGESSKGPSHFEPTSGVGDWREDGHNVDTAVEAGRCESDGGGKDGANRL